MKNSRVVALIALIIVISFMTLGTFVASTDKKALIMKVTFEKMAK